MLNRLIAKKTLLEFVFFSKKRKSLLFLLRGGSKTLQEIKESLSISSSGIIPEIRKMEKMHMIYYTDKLYTLTEIGGVLANNIFQFEGTVRIFGTNPKYWNEHKISGIPREFHLRLYELGDYKIIESNLSDIFMSQNECLKNMSKAKRIRGVCPVFNPMYIESALSLVNKDIDVLIILPSQFLEKIKEKYKIEPEGCDNYKKTHIMVCDERIEVNFNVTDFCLSMGLFLKDSTYDIYREIICFEQSALKWGEDLFSYYERRSKNIEI